MAQQETEGVLAQRFLREIYTFLNEFSSATPSGGHEAIL